MSSPETNRDPQNKIPNNDCSNTVVDKTKSTLNESQSKNHFEDHSKNQLESSDQIGDQTHDVNNKKPGSPSIDVSYK